MLKFAQISLKNVTFLDKCQHEFGDFAIEMKYSPQAPVVIISLTFPILIVHVEIDLLHPPCRCKGASHYGLSADRKRRSQEGECTDSTSELTIATLPNDSTNSATMALLSDDPGLVNPAFDPSMEDHNSQSGSTTSLAARSSSKKSECECAGGCLCVLTSCMTSMPGVFLGDTPNLQSTYSFLNTVFVSPNGL